MDIVQMKMLTEMIVQLGEESREVFIWWLVLEKVPGILFGLLWSVIGCVVLFYIYRIYLTFLVGEKLRKAANVRVLWSAAELARAEDVLKKHF